MLVVAACIPSTTTSSLYPLPTQTRGYIASYSGLFNSSSSYARNTNSNISIATARADLHLVKIDVIHFKMAYWPPCGDHLDIYGVQKHWRADGDGQRVSRFCRSNTTSLTSELYFPSKNVVTLNFQSQATQPGPYKGGFLIQYTGRAKI